MQVNPERLGEWTRARQFSAGESVIAAYAAAIGVDRARSTLAPPLFGVVPAREPMLEAQRLVVPEGLRAATSVHGEHDFVLERLIEPGSELETRSAVVGVHVVSAGTQIVTKTVTTLLDRAPVDEQYWTTLLRGVDVGWSGGEHPPEKPTASGDADDEAETWVAPDLSRKYAEATGDRDAYVLDEAAARAAGFPGIILHGLCTMALATRAVVDRCGEGDSGRLRRVGVRFTRPLVLGQQITTALARLDDRCLFEVFDASGAAVIRRGVAEFRSPAEVSDP